MPTHRPTRRTAVLAVALTLVALAVVAPPATPATAAIASLVADINPGTTDRFNSGGPVEMLALGGKLLFVAGGVSGYEIWISDGTPLGTGVLADVCPEGSCDPADLLAATPSIAFFSLRDRLWVTDGTRAGTFPVGPAPQLDHPFGGALALAGSTLFFNACEDLACGVWKSDGSKAGTRLAATFESQFAPYGFTAVGSTLYFLVRNAANGNPDLWRTDGTAAGTANLHSFLYPDPRLLTAAGNRLFFIAQDYLGSVGEELWTSDGTPAGTRQLTNFAAPTPFAGTQFLEPAGGAVYFVANDTGGADLWTSDGTVAGTRRVTDFGFAQPFDFNFFGPEQFAKVGSRLIFVATDGLSGMRLWTSDGTPAGTEPLDGCPEGCPAIAHSFDQPFELVLVGDRVLFAGSDPAHGREPWASDGTAAGTRRVRDLCTGPCESAPEGFVVLRGRAYFAGWAGPTAGWALWRSDGTAAGTRRVVLLGQGAFSYPLEGFRGVVAGRKIFFLAFDPDQGQQLWVSDGTVAGTALVTALGGAGSGSQPLGLAAAGGKVVLTACDGQARALWASDGTGGGTGVLADLDTECRGGNRFIVSPRGDLAFFAPDYVYDPQLWRTDGTPGGTFELLSFQGAVIGIPVALGSQVFFFVFDEGGPSFWKTDGTRAGTVKAFDLPDAIRNVDTLAAFGSQLYFLADTDQRNLWVTDGTLAGTRQLTDLGAHSFRLDYELVRAGTTVFFVESARLWKTDGTAAGTAPVTPADGAAGRQVFGLQPLGGSVLFFATTGEAPGRHGLWRSDGTAAGTVLLAAAAPESQFPFDQPPIETAALGARVYFAADDGVHGLELWASDGTATGTVLVRDIAPGAGSASPTSLVAAGGRLFFAAGDGVHGRELWESDGTAAGTRLVQDIAPGGSASAPEELTAAGGRLFFSADDGAHGRELWALPLDAPPACQPSSTAVCLGGRFRVEIYWRDFEGRTGEGRAAALTADTGYFWFFNPANVEVILKVLDAREVNGHFWVFFGALTNVQYAVTVTDTQTGAARRYLNPSGLFGSLGDTNAFGPLGATGSGLSLGPSPAAAALPEILSRAGAATPATAATATLAAAPCVAGPTRLCLNGGRFAVEARWRDFQGKTGVGMAVPVTGDTGYFWFFNAANVEVMLKVLDGRDLNGKFWVFYGALSSVEYTLTVTDTQTGAAREYPNPSGRFASVGDTDAF